MSHNWTFYFHMRFQKISILKTNPPYPLTRISFSFSRTIYVWRRSVNVSYSLLKTTLYVEEFSGSIFIGGVGVQNGNELMFAQTEHEKITLPSLPDKFGDMTELKYHSVKKHGHNIFMVGGESNMGDSDNMIWSMDVRNLTDLKWTYYSQLQLQMQYSSFQIVHDKLVLNFKFLEVSARMISVCDAKFNGSPRIFVGFW